MAGVCFILQAEDGMRDLVRSRGLEDVYKRQGNASQRKVHRASYARLAVAADASRRRRWHVHADPVSYTHLTLPSDLV